MKCFIMTLLAVLVGCTGHSDVNIPPSITDMFISGGGGYTAPIYNTTSPVGTWLGTVPTENKPYCPSNVWDGDICITTPGFGSL